MPFALILAVLGAVAAFSSQAMAAGPNRVASAQPVELIRGKYCVAYGPPGYAVAAENPQRVAFGADISRADQRAGASYAVFAGGAVTGIAANATPEGAIVNWITSMGRNPARFGQPRPVEPGVFAVEYQTQQTRGLAIYRVIPQQGGFVVVMRYATAYPDVWAKSANEIVAIARSMRCQVPMVPAAADPPPRPRERKSGEKDSEYNRWLGMENYHDSRTGQNYWVSPSRDWSENGPQGAGYYIRNGNDTIKLDSGYSR